MVNSGVGILKRCIHTLLTLGLLAVRMFVLGVFRGRRAPVFPEAMAAVLLGLRIGREPEPAGLSHVIALAVCRVLVGRLGRRALCRELAQLWRVCGGCCSSFSNNRHKPAPPPSPLAPLAPERRDWRLNGENGA